jgi:hypothetical protein
VRLDELFNFDAGNPFILSQPGEYAVEAGPVPTVAFRQAAAQQLAELLEGVSQAQAEVALKRRVRVVQGISKRAAEALVEAIGRRETAAKVVQGAAARNSPWKGGTPVLGGVAAGIAGGFLAGPIVGVAAGVVLLGGIAFGNSRGTMSVLGSPPLRPELPREVAEAPERMADIVEQLPEVARDNLLTVGRAGFHIIGRLMDTDDLISVAGDGLEGGLGRAAISMVAEAVRVAELISAGGPGANNSERFERLKGLAAAADQALSQLGALAEALQDDPGSAQDAMARETEMLSATVDALKKMN